MSKPTNSPIPAVNLKPAITAGAIAALLGGGAFLAFASFGSSPSQESASRESASVEPVAVDPPKHGHATRAHSCNFASPMGLAASLDRSSLTVSGRAVARHDAGDGAAFTEIAVDEVLWSSPRDAEARTVAGQKIPAPAHIAVLSAPADESDCEFAALPIGENVLLFLNPVADLGDAAQKLAVPAGLAAYVPIGAMNGVVRCDEAICGGSLQLARVLSETAATRLEPAGIAKRAEALANAVTTGGHITAYRAAIDLTKSQPAVDSLAPEAVTALAAMIDRSDILVCRELMTVLSSRKDPALIPALVRVLDRADSKQLFDEFARVLGTDSLREDATSLLRPYLAANRNPQTRRFAAFAVARLGSETGKSECRALLADPDSDIASEALIGLAGSDDAALRSRAYDTLRAVLAETPVVDDPSPIATIVRTHEFQQARHALHTGSQFAQLAAGYFLARSPNATDRNWLAGRASRIKDFSVRVFVRDRLANGWTDFDAPW
jgi:hypothetical protein